MPLIVPCTCVERSRLEGFEGVVGVALEAVEEVLGVVDDLADVGGEKADRVANHREVLSQRDAEDLGGLEVPALSDNGHRGGFGLDQRLHSDVVLRGDSLAARHSKRRDLGVLEVEVAHSAEVGGILGVGEGIAPFDVVDPEAIELQRDQELVLEREVDPLTLAAVAQGCVVDRNPRHVAVHPCFRTMNRLLV